MSNKTEELPSEIIISRPLEFDCKLPNAECLEQSIAFRRAKLGLCVLENLDIKKILENCGFGIHQLEGHRDVKLTLPPGWFISESVYSELLCSYSHFIFPSSIDSDTSITIFELCCKRLEVPIKDWIRVVKPDKISTIRPYLKPMKREEKPEHPVINVLWKYTDFLKFGGYIILEKTPGSYFLLRRRKVIVSKEGENHHEMRDEYCFYGELTQTQNGTLYLIRYEKSFCPSKSGIFSSRWIKVTEEYFVYRPYISQQRYLPLIIKSPRILFLECTFEDLNHVLFNLEQLAELSNS